MTIKIKTKKISNAGEEPITDKQLKYMKSLCSKMRIKLPRGNPKHLITKNAAQIAIKHLIAGDSIEFV